MAPKLKPRQPKKSSKNLQKVKKRVVKRKTARASRARPQRHGSQSSSVQLVAVFPCCSNEKKLRKYSRLGLDSALFCSKRRPAKRKQSHISVITISSSDEETSNTRVVEWLESMELDKRQSHLCDEEVFIGDMDPTVSESRTAQVCDADGIRHQMSLLHLPSSSSQRIGPHSVDMPERQTEQPLETLTSVTRVEVTSLLDTSDINPLPSIGSFFTNPQSNFNRTRKGPHSVWSGMSPGVLNLEENNDQNSPKFFFGTPEQEPITSTSSFLNSEINNFPSTSSGYSSKTR